MGSAAVSVGRAYFGDLAMSQQILADVPAGGGAKPGPTHVVALTAAADVLGPAPRPPRFQEGAGAGHAVLATGPEVAAAAGLCCDRAGIKAGLLGWVCLVRRLIMALTSFSAVDCRLSPLPGEALLVLADAHLARGLAFGAVGTAIGEVMVFNTGMDPAIGVNQPIPLTSVSWSPHYTGNWAPPASMPQTKNRFPLKCPRRDCRQLAPAPKQLALPAGSLASVGFERHGW